MARLVVANPLAERNVTDIRPAERPTSLGGKTIGLYWNIKAGGDVALDRAEQLLRTRYPDAEFVRLLGSIGSTVRHLTNADSDRIATTCHAVVGTTGD
jgi:hypothetical protein